MRYYTKEYYRLLEAVGSADMFSPVIDKDVYTDEDIEEIYQKMLDDHIEEEREMFDEPPFFAVDYDEDIDEEEFDPEDYVICDLTEEGDEIDFRHPESLEELIAYQNEEYERELEAYENRGEFDEALAAEVFEEDYRDNLAEPDEDVPEWVRSAVDPRLLAMGAVPESIYKKMLAEDEKNQARLDELEEAADDGLEDMYAEMPDEYIDLPDDLDDLDGDYVISLESDDGDYIITLAGWDEEGDPAIRTITCESVEVIEDEGFAIEVSTDEDGDIESNGELLLHEVYYEDGKFEAHFLLENDGLKYLTLRCSDIQIEQQCAE